MKKIFNHGVFFQKRRYETLLLKINPHLPGPENFQGIAE